MVRQIFRGALASPTLHKNHSWLFGSAKPYCHFKTETDKRAAVLRQLNSHFSKSSFLSSQTRNLGNWLCALPPASICLNHKFVRAGSERNGSHRYFHTCTTFGASKNRSASKGDLQYPLLPSESPDTLIETWFYTVASRGCLHLNLPFTTVVRPLNPQSHPDMDKAIIEIHFDVNCGEVPPSQNLSQIGDMYRLDVGFDQDMAKLNVAANVTSGVALPVVCVLWIPLQSDLTATVLLDKDLTVEKLESNVMNLSTEQGNCYLKSLKCGSVNVQCSAGNIVSKSTVLGNIVFQAGMSGAIQADKLQGSSVVCQTEMGDIGVKSLYADTTMVRTTGGSVQYGQCHGQMVLQAGQSDVKIGSLEGDIDIGMLSGSVSVHFSRHSNSNIDIKDGDICLSFPDGASTDLDLDCHQVNLGKNVTMEFEDTDMPNHIEGYIGERGKASVHARTLSGTIDVKQLDWIHSTNLAFQ